MTWKGICLEWYSTSDYTTTYLDQNVSCLGKPTAKPKIYNASETLDQVDGIYFLLRFYEKQKKEWPDA